MAQINKSSDYFNTVLYTGNGTADRTVTGVGFQPQLLWIKERSNVSTHSLTDIVRGASKRLQCATTDAEFDTGTDNVKSFDSDGFTLGTGGQVNENTQTYVSWNWLANGTGASNTDGSITSTVSANTTSGFSIVSWTGNGTSGATIGHGISTPDVIIAKSRSGSHNWYVYHKSNGVGYGKLNLTDAFNSATDVFTVAPTSSVFTISADTSINNSGDNFIAYCFAEKKGFSKAFSYTGNGSTDGSFCYLGMKPKFIMIKRTDSTGDWVIYDGVKEPYNVIDTYLEANSSNADTTLSVRELDILSNGFKVRGTNTSINASGGSYIGIAFAESPLVGTNNTPAVAR